jgi:hypothetical protein
VSIGNVLAMKQSFSCKKAFSLNVEALLANVALPATARQNELITRIREIADQITPILPHITAEGDAKTAKGFIMDFDLATRWTTYFCEDHSKGSISVSIPHLS